MEKVVESICIDIEILKRKFDNKDLISVEDIQDMVEQWLMKAEQFDVAKRYIIYRNEHKKIREEKKENIKKQIEENNFYVIKKDGKKELFDIWKIKKTYDLIALDLAEKCPFTQIEKDLTNYIVDDIKTEDINKLLVKTAVNLISIDNIDWQFIAWRFLTIDLYKKVSRTKNIEINQLHDAKTFANFMKEYVDEWWFYDKFFEYYSMEDFVDAGNFLKPERDMEYGYTTLLMLNKRYLCNPNKVYKELPQYMYLAIALFLAIPEKRENRLEITKEIYDAYIILVFWSNLFSKENKITTKTFFLNLHNLYNLIKNNQ